MPLRNQSHLTTFAIGFAAGAAVGANWPHLKKHVGPLAAIASDKFSDLYTMITRLIAEQKEIFDDELEERKAEGRKSATAHKNGAAKASVSKEVDEEKETESEEDFAASLAAAFAKTIIPEPRVKVASARKAAPKRKTASAVNGTAAHANGASRAKAPAVKVAARRKKSV